MDLSQLSRGQIDAGLGAMKAVALVNGRFDEEERVLLRAAARALGVDTAPEAIAAVEPAALANAIADPTWRERALQALVVMALIDGEATADEAALIDRYAAALGVSDPRVKNLHQLVDGHLTRLRVDFFRRMPLPKKMLGQAWEAGGLPGVWKYLRANVGHGPVEPDVAWRYKKLGLLPEGTLGREFWKHMTERGFAFPGEPGGLPELAVHHDFTHVLTGYDTDPSGETQIAAFYAGYFREDPFAFLFMTLLMFHVGVHLAPNDAIVASKGHWDPAKIVLAIRRGAHVTVDMTAGWTPWDVVAKPLDEVRREYGLLD